MNQVVTLTQTLPSGKGSKTRFAPSPTGLLHLGHIASAIYVWGLAETLAAKVSLRIEDHDGQRCRPEFTRAIIDTLKWLGLLTDSDPISIQSQHPERYTAALDTLERQGLVYACTCSRKDLALRLGLAEPQGELHYDGYCRERFHPRAPGSALRVRLAETAESFLDGLQGPQTQWPAQQGDLLILDKHGQWTYNFCVVVDDLAEGIDLVIRGLDILPSTGRQLALARALGHPGPKTFFHHPLIQGPSGEKLSKRLGSTGVQTLREQGATPDEILGKAAFAVGLQPEPRPLTRTQLGALFQ